MSARRKLTRANLTGARLSLANLRGADLTNADLSAANLSDANLNAAELTKADLSGAWVSFTNFGELNLSETKGLESVNDSGPSTIGIDTFYNSEGKFPNYSCAGQACPIPSSPMQSLLSGRIEFYSCFISYSTQNQQFADRLYADLQARVVRCWFAPRDVVAGRKLHEQIDETIRHRDKLLLTL